ncbi:MAG: UDP-3-O-(3-hydroxymyristoyl)glucosamine N-acyltransferase [Gammaproteobacteria bacterium]|nr:UDP-3-O-(3-hydroxymyristoyl)glucosamine N-acyltransferase [Gammaproteobacteria bacterium]
MRAKLGELAARFGCELIGDPQVEVCRVSTLSDAGPGSVSFLANAAYTSQLRTTTASVVIVTASDVDACPTAVLITDDPYLTFARIASVLYPPTPVDPGVHASAVISTSAQVAASAQISASVVVGEDAVIGEDVFVGPGCVIGDCCSLDTASRLVANVTLVQNVTVGKRTIVHPGAVLGADGFGNAKTATGWLKVPQVGGVNIGDDVEIGANTTIDRGAIGDTVIENGVRLDNLIQIAHNVRIGEHTAIAATAGISGSAIIGKRCMLAGRVGVFGHVTICDDVILGAAAVATKDITEPGFYSAHFPAEKSKNWRQKVARFRRFDKLADRLRKLEEVNKKNDG